MRASGDQSPAEGRKAPKTARDVVLALGKDEARFVGGCVRDLFRGTEPKDWDIATKHRPEQTRAILSKRGYRVIDTGIDYGTVTAVCPDGEQYEITTLRRDVDTDGRRATVIEYSDSWEEDARRRDFTMNALYMDASHVYHDPLGTGIEDAVLGIVRYIDSPRDRIEEDYLRALRYFRFLARIGGVIDHASFDASFDALMSDRLRDNVSGERQRDETLKILVQPFAVSVVSMMVASEYFGREAKPLRLASMEKAEWIDTDPDPIRRLAALNPSPHLIEKFKLSNDERKRYDILVASGRGVRYTEESIPHLCYQFGPDIARDIILMSMAEVREYDKVDLASDSFREYEFPLRGSDLIERGFGEGKELGEKLRKFEETWIASDMKLTRETLLTMLDKETKKGGESFTPWTAKGKFGW